MSCSACCKYRHPRFENSLRISQKRFVGFANPFLRVRDRSIEDCSWRSLDARDKGELDGAFRDLCEAYGEAMDVGEAEGGAGAPVKKKARGEGEGE